MLKGYVSLSSRTKSNVLTIDGESGRLDDQVRQTDPNKTGILEAFVAGAADFDLLDPFRE